MGARRLCTAEVRVRFSYGPPINNCRLIKRSGRSHKPIRARSVTATCYQFNPSVAQPGSASALGAEGREFEPLHSDHVLFQCSTAVVQLTVNQLVVGSIPATGAIQSRDRVKVIRESHKLQMGVRFPLPQPVFLPL